MCAEVGIRSKSYPPILKTRLILVLPLLIGWGAGEPAAAQVPAAVQCDVDLDLRPVIIRLDDTGIQHWDFLNPRRPFPLARPKRGVTASLPLSEGCYEKARQTVPLEIKNNSSRPFEVIFPFSLAEKPVQALEERLDAIEDRLKLENDVLILQDLASQFDLLDRGTPAEKDREELNLELERFERLRSSSREGSWTAQDLSDIQDNIELEFESIKKNIETPMKTVWEKRDLDSWKAAVSQCRLALRSFRAAFRNKGYELVTCQAPKQPPAPNAIAPATSCPSGQVEVGDPSLQDLQDCAANLPSAPTPPTLPEDAPEAEKAAAQEFTQEKVAFEQEIAAFKQEVSRVVAAPSLVLLAKNGKKFSDICKLGKRAAYDCSYTLSIPEQGERPVDPRFLEFSVNPVVFTARFQQEAEQLANSTGYLSVSPSFPEPENVSRWKVGASLGYSVVPNLERVVKFVSGAELKEGPKGVVAPELPYGGEQKSAFPGNASLRLEQTLGNRANVTVGTTFKAGNLGSGSETESALTVSDYQFNVYGQNGLRLNFGKSSFVTTRDNVALQEAGEGFQLQFHSFSAGLVVKREHKVDTLPKSSYNKWLAVLQSRNLNPPGDPFRSLNLLLAIGRNKGEPFFDLNGDSLLSDHEKKAPRFVPYEYGTAGFELDFGPGPERRLMPLDGTSKWFFGGNLSAYYSRREVSADHSTLLNNADGFSTLLTLTFNQQIDTKKRTVPQLFFIRAGYGTGDDPKTPENDGYLGESASFAPDQIFLKRFAASIYNHVNTTEPVPHLDGKLAFRPGLSNKTYLGLTYINSDRSNPLAYLAKLLQSEEQIESKSFTARVHGYRFNEKVFDTNWAGVEGNLEFQVEIPKGVTTSFFAAYFQPANELKHIIKKAPWSVSTLVKVSL